MRHFWQQAVLLGAAFFLVACAPLPVVDTPERLVVRGQAQGFLASVVQAGPFSVPVLVRGRGVVAHVYLEGDGAAWWSAYSPPPDPTPKTPLALLLAEQDAAPMVVYLPRACQYLSSVRGCEMRYWTTHRFAPELVQSYDALLEGLRTRHGVQQFVLFGYSGGGVLAMLLAGRRDDVVRVVTVASPVDVPAWTAHHGVTPLVLPVDAPEALRRAAPRAVYLVGERDRVVPPEVLAPFARRQGGCLKTLDGFTHACCWVDIWPDLLREVGQ